MKEDFIVVVSCNYPCESGRNIIDDFSNYNSAMECAYKLINLEKQNFICSCGDAFPINEMKVCGENEYNGYCITSKNGIDDYFYVTKVIKVKMFT